MKPSVYSVEAGRSILRDGEPFVILIKARTVDPVEADALCHTVAAALNAQSTQAAQIEGLRGVLTRLAVLSDDGLPYSPDIHLVREARALLSNLPAAPQTWFDERAAGYVAPSLLQRAYTVLADIRHDWPGRVSPEGQSLLCAMREEIAKQTGSTGEAVSTGVKCDFVRAALDKQTAALGGSPVRKESEALDAVAKAASGLVCDVQGYLTGEYNEYPDLMPMIEALERAGYPAPGTA